MDQENQTTRRSTEIYLSNLFHEKIMDQCCSRKRSNGWYYFPLSSSNSSVEMKDRPNLILRVCSRNYRNWFEGTISVPSMMLSILPLWSIAWDLERVLVNSNAFSECSEWQSNRSNRISLSFQIERSSSIGSDRSTFTYGVATGRFRQGLGGTFSRSIHRFSSGSWQLIINHGICPLKMRNWNFFELLINGPHLVRRFSKWNKLQIRHFLNNCSLQSTKMALIWSIRPRKICWLLIPLPVYRTGRVEIRISIWSVVHSLLSVDGESLSAFVVDGGWYRAWITSPLWNTPGKFPLSLLLIDAQRSSSRATKWMIYWLRTSV